jgi:bacteriocin-like protein
MLAPLLNPGTERDAAAERFIEKLKQLGREPVTLTEKELSRVSGGRASGCAPIVGRGGK